MVDTLEKRRKIYAYILLACILALAGIGIMGVWGMISFGDFSVLMKLIITFIIVGMLSGFLYTLSFQQEAETRKYLVYISGVMGIALSGTILLQTWLQFFDETLFGRLILTFIVIGVISAFIIALFDDFFENKKLKDENYLD